MFHLSSDGVWDFDEILHELSNRHFDTAFINFYSSTQGRESKMIRLQELRDAPKLMKQILKVSINVVFWLFVQGKSNIGLFKSTVQNVLVIVGVTIGSTSLDHRNRTKYGKFGI